MSNPISSFDMIRNLAGSGSGSGKAVGSVEEVTPESELSSAQESYDDEVRAENSTVDDLLPSSEDAPADSKDAASSAAANPKADGKPSTPDKEVITISDEKGRRKIEIDYSDREAIKKAFQFQHGARKWQAERDQAIQGKKSIETELTQMKQDWSALEQAYQKGPEELFDLLQGRRGAFKEHINKQFERAEFLRTASPKEIEALEARERAEQTARDLEKLRKENEEFKSKVESEREQAELRSVESRINPVFDRYRFAGKLGNADDEQIFDKMLWNTALERLSPYEEQGQPLTPELVEREFRNVASVLRKRINVQAEKKVSKVVEQKKQEATENVQAKLMSGYRTSGAAKEARDLIESGNLTSLLKGWGKYGSLFQK